MVSRAPSRSAFGREKTMNQRKGAKRPQGPIMDVVVLALRLFHIMV